MRRPPSVKQSIRVCRGVLSVDHREVIELRRPPCFYPHSVGSSMLMTPRCLMGSVQPGAAIYPAEYDVLGASALCTSNPRKSSQSPGLGGLRSLICSFGSLPSRLEFLAHARSPYS